MSRKILIIDTSLLLCLLKVPGKETAGSTTDRWDHVRVKALLDEEKAKKSTFVLPLATIIETGNHISQCNGDMFVLAQNFCAIIEDSANAQSPWAPFTDQADLWMREKLIELASAWPTLAASKLSIGDATIKDVANYYAKTGFSVEILTADAGLRAYQHAAPATPPRRRS